MTVELDVSDLLKSLDFYRSLGFAVAVDRPNRGFAYLTRDGVDVMLQTADGPGERLRTSTLERPFGRGVCLVIPVPDVDALFLRFVAAGGVLTAEIHERSYQVEVLRPTSRWPREGARQIVNRQFVVADPDGYLLRLYTERTN